MDTHDIICAISDAREFTRLHGDTGLSLEALALMHLLKRLQSPTTITTSITPSPPPTPISHPRAIPEVQEYSDDEVPKWFTDALPQFTGRRVTPKDIMEAIGRPTDLGSLRLAGAWLRMLFGPPKRSNGRASYHIPYQETGTSNAPPGAIKSGVVPPWMEKLLQEKRRDLRGTMSLGAAADALDHPREGPAAERLRQHLTALGFASDMGHDMFYFGE
jgi:hypothetical protein